MTLETESDYEAALKEISPHFDDEPALGSPEGDRFEMLCLLIEEYEKKHYPMWWIVSRILEV